MKTIEPSPIICPQLNREISHGECYDTRMGFKNILVEIGIDDDTAWRDICFDCEARKPKQNPIEIAEEEEK